MFRWRGLSRLARRFNSQKASSAPKPGRAGLYSAFALASTSLGVAGYYYGRKKVIDNPPEFSFPWSSTTKLEDINSPDYCTTEEFNDAIAELAGAIGKENVSESRAELEGFTDNGFSPRPPEPGQVPKAIVYAHSTEDVSKILTIAHKYSVPVVPYSGGTSLEGHTFSTRCGIILNTSRMNKVLKINYDDLDAVVQAGVNWMELDKELAHARMMFGCDCGPTGLIGGMVNTNASGINASRYGAMRDNVISLTVVLADGTVIKTRQRPRKTSAGYNLTGLFVGSEGTLGIVTEAVVKIQVKPQVETVAVGQFPTVEAASQTVAELFKRGIRPEAIELLDDAMMQCTNFSGAVSRKWLEVPTIFFKLGGLNQAVVDETLKIVKEVAHDNDCKDFIIAKDKAEGDELFEARKNALFSLLDYGKSEIHEDVKLWITDIAVPISRLPKVCDEIRELTQKSGFHSVILGHVGDGNLHADLFYLPHQAEECHKVIDEMTLIGLRNEGTATGEHGIGNGKRPFLKIELGEEAVNTMRKLKLALDPKRILNPDKVFKIDPKDDGEF
ncbi:hypothetical protein FT663_00928 [Candidozyma haemuli var. vulneris]|nr:hypothetical protein FT662_00732 [[Candida] haemuloni var. vulneris]KAF3994954.1 hypothetical protein FT663_00928 [[Candida] haemuloni var. vulneris]